MSMMRIGALTKRNLKEIMRDPLSLGFLYGLPVVMLVLFYLIFHKATAQFEMRYLAPAMVGFGQAFIALFSGMLLATDRSSSFMSRLFATRTRPSEFILSYIVAMLPAALSQTFIFLWAAVIIDFSFFSPYLFLTLIFSLFTGAFYIGTGLFIGSLTNEKSIGGVASFIVMAQSVMSGMWFPVEGLDSGFMKTMNVLPFKNISMMMQNVAAGNITFDGVFLPLIIVLAYTAVMFVAAVAVFRRKMTQ